MSDETSTPTWEFELGDTDVVDLSSYSWSDIGVTAALSAAVGFFLLMVFERMRTRDSYKYVYQSRFVYGNNAAPPSPRFLSWLIPTAKTPNYKVLEHGGMDAYVFIRYLTLCFRICAFSSFWGLLVLLPIYASADIRNDNFSRFSLVNVTQGSSLLWAVPPFAYLFMLHIMYLLKTEFRMFAELRNTTLAGDVFREERGRLVAAPTGDVDPQAMFTIIVERIPPEYRSNRRLYAIFDKMFPNLVHSAQVCLKHKELEELEEMVEMRVAIVRRVERMMVLQSAGKLSEAKAKQLEEDQQTLVDLNQMVHEQQLHWRNFQQRADREELTEDEVARLEEEDDLPSKMGSIKNITLDELEGGGALNTGGRRMSSKIAAPLLASPLLSTRSSVVGGDDKDASPPPSPPPRGGGEEETCGRRCARLARGCRALGRRARREAGLSAGLVARGGLGGVRKLGEVLGKLTIGDGVSSTGFVTFRTLKAKAAAAQMLLVEHPMRFQAAAAPEPRDVLWPNVRNTLSQINLRRNLTNALLVLGMLLWSALVSFVQAISSIENLKNVFPWLSNLSSSNPFLYSLISGYLPVCILLIIVQLLPFAFQGLEQFYVGVKARSAVQITIAMYFFYYQLANVYVSITSGSLAAALSEILEDPSALLAILADALPTVSVYFVDTLLVKILVGLPVELCRLWPLTRMTGVHLFTDVRLRTVNEAKEGVFGPPELLYGWYYPNLLYALLIVLVYAVISPLVVPVGAVYFGLALIVYKYQVLNVYIPNYESGGAFWFKLYYQTLYSLVTAQVTLVGYMIVKQAPTLLVLALVPLPLATLWYGRNTGSAWSDSSAKLSLLKAVELDEAEERLLGGEAAPGRARAFSVDFNEDSYLQPILRVGPVVPNPQLAFKSRDENGMFPHHHGGAAAIQQEHWHVHYQAAAAAEDPTASFNNTTAAIVPQVVAFEEEKYEPPTPSDR